MVARMQRGLAGRLRRGVVSVALVVAMGSFVACAPKQRVPLDLGPGAVELYVDGRRVEGLPNELELRSDRDHKLFVKRPGYLPELVVLESREVAGEETLEPGEVRVRLSPLVGDRRLEIEEAGPGDPQR